MALNVFVSKDSKMKLHVSNVLQTNLFAIISVSIVLKIVQLVQIQLVHV